MIQAPDFTSPPSVALRWGVVDALKQILSKHVILELDLFTMIFQWFCMDVFVSVVVFGEAECDIKSNMLGWEKQFQRFSMHNIIQ